MVVFTCILKRNKGWLLIYVDKKKVVDWKFMMFIGK